MQEKTRKVAEYPDGKFQEIYLPSKKHCHR
jgi:hypothetical protein